MSDKSKKEVEKSMMKMWGIKGAQKQKRYNYNHTTKQLHTKLFTSPSPHNPGVSKSFENWVV